MSAFSDMVTLHPVCASARPPKKSCSLCLVPTLSILLYPFAAVWDRLLELTMEVLQPRVQVVEQGTGLPSVSLLVPEQAIDGAWQWWHSCHHSCLCCCPCKLFPFFVFKLFIFSSCRVFVARTILVVLSHLCPWRQPRLWPQPLVLFVPSWGSRILLPLLGADGGVKADGEQLGQWCLELLLEPISTGALHRHLFHEAKTWFISQPFSKAR